MPSPPRFILFAFDQYYPGGPSEDERSRHHSLEDARAAAKVERYDFTEILDLDSGEWLV